MHYVKILLALATLTTLLSGCAGTYLAERGSYLKDFHQGDLFSAERKINDLACKSGTEKNFQKSKEGSWILLDRATLLFAMGKTDEAIRDYSCALESLDFYDKTLPIEQCAQVLTQDDASAYQADDFEQVLARLYFALVLLHKGDESNAFALLRQAEEYQQEKLQFYAKVPFTRHYRLPENGLCKYLFALLLEKRGDFSNSDLLYRQAFSLIPTSSPAPPPHEKGKGTILVVCHNGNVLRKVSATSAASVASACALEFMLASRKVDPAWSSLTGIPVPALTKWPDSTPLPTFAQIDGCQVPLMPYYSVSQAAAYDLEQKMPLIVARGVARFLIRRSTVEYMNRQDPCLGMLADLTMLAINENTKADTRSWSTLPDRIDAARFEVGAGTHLLHLRIIEGCVEDVRTYSVVLKPNDLCIVHIFNIHPGVRQVLIPSRHQGDSL